MNSLHMMNRKTLSFLVFVLVACTRVEPDTNVSLQTALILGTGTCLPLTRAANPDETLVSDYNIFIFNDFGGLEEKAFVRGGTVYHTRLLKEVPYTVLAVANMGYALPIASWEDASSFRCHLAYPDEYSRGMPMAALLRRVRPSARIDVPLERLMARIDLSVDRSGLSPETFVKVVEARIGHCPSSASLFPGSEALDTFYEGFTKRYGEVEDLNRPGGTVSLYVLENCAPGTFVDLEAEYHSGSVHTDPGERVTYRIELERLERNTVYPVVVRLYE